MAYDPDILRKHPTLHHDIFRLNYKEMQKAIEETYDEDDGSWERSDYEDVRRVLDHMHRAKRDTLDSFAARMKKLKGLEKLPLRERFRFIYLLLSSYVDWRRTTVQPVTIVGQPAMYLNEAIQKDAPRIELDFQAMLDALLIFQPSPDQQAVWAEVFSQGPSEHQPHPSGSAERGDAD